MSKGLLAPQSEKVRTLELSIEEIRQAKDELIRMNNDSTQRELYDMRANSLRDKISELNAVERKGIEKGLKKGREEGREEGKKEENMISQAESILNSTPIGNRTAEWYYLKGMCAFRRGWSEEAFNNFTTACNMDPNNQEYRAALNNMNNQRSYNYGGYNQPNMQNQVGGCSCCDVCTAMICADCLCDCCRVGC